MKYVPPVGASDQNESYITGNPATGVQGSRLGGEAIEHPQREIVQCITDAGLSPSESDLGQLTRAVRIGRTTAPVAGEVGEVIRINDILAHSGSGALTAGQSLPIVNIPVPSDGVWMLSTHIFASNIPAQSRIVISTSEDPIYIFDSTLDVFSYHSMSLGYRQKDYNITLDVNVYSGTWDIPYCTINNCRFTRIA